MQKLSLVFIKPELIEPNIWIIALKMMKNNKIMENKYKGRRELSSGSYWFGSVWSTWECRFHRLTDQQALNTIHSTSPIIISGRLFLFQFFFF